MSTSFSLNIYLFDKLYNTIQYNTIQYNTIQYNTIQYNTIQCNTIQYNTIQNNTMQCNKYSTIQHNTIQYNTKQYNTIQRVYKLGSGKKPVRLIQIRFPTSFETKLRFTTIICLHAENFIYSFMENVLPIYIMPTVKPQCARIFYCLHV